MQSKTRILIADDDQTTAKSVADYLSRRNCEIAFAGSHEESLRTIRSFDPSLVLLDYTLPPIDGGETLERLKQLRPELPVIVYSGHAAPEVIFRVSKLGADDYIATPFQLSDLYSRISRAIEKRSSADGAGLLRDRVRQQSDFATLFGTSARMEEIKKAFFVCINLKKWNSLFFLDQKNHGRNMNRCYLMLKNFIRNLRYHIE